MVIEMGEAPERGVKLSSGDRIPVEIEGDFEDQSSTEYFSRKDTLIYQHASSCLLRETCVVSQTWEQPNEFSFEAESSIYENDDRSVLALETRPKVFMVSSSVDPRHPSNSQHNHNMAFEKARSASRRSKRLEDENMGNKSLLGFHALDYDSAHHSVKRIYWDLNVPMEQWNVTVSGEHGMDNKSSCGIMHEQKNEGCFRRDPTFRTSIIENRRCSLRVAADSERDYEGSLELQLRPPSRPELHIRWGNKPPPDLTLWLAGTHSEASCSPVKPESSKYSRGMETETAHYNISKSVDTSHVKSEPCDGSFQVESSKEFEGHLANMELDNHRLTSCCTKSTPSKAIPVIPNEDATPAVDMLPHYNSMMPGDAKISSNDDRQRVVKPESSSVSRILPDDNSDMPCNTNIKPGEDTCPATVPGALSGSPCKAGNDSSNVCTHQHAEGSSNKSSDTAEPVLSNSQICNTNGSGNPETGVIFATPHTDNEEPVAYDCMSEGSAEMDCSDDQYYSSQVQVAGNFQVDYEKTSVPQVVSSIGSEQAPTVKTSVPYVASLTGNEKPQGAPEGPSGMQEKTSVAQCGSVDAEEGKPGDAEPRVTEKSCEHGEKRMNGNMVTDSIGLDDQPTTGLQLHRVTRDKQIVLEEVSGGPSVDNFVDNVCLDKKETSCKTTMSSATRMQKASSGKKLTEPSQEALKKLPRKKGSVVKPKPAKPQSVIAKPKPAKPQSVIAKSETSAAVKPLKTRDADASINHPEPTERGSNINSLTVEKTHDEVQQSDQTKKVVSLGFSSSGQRDPVSARSVRTGYEQDKFDDLQRREWPRFRGKRHPKYYTHNNHVPNYVHFRRGGNPRFHRGAHHRTEVIDDSRRQHLRRLRGDQPNHSSHFPPNRQLPEIPPGAPIYSNSNGRFIGREVDEIPQLGRNDIMADNSTYQHSSMPPQALEAHRFPQDVIATGNWVPPYSQLHSDSSRLIHPMDDLDESCRPGAFLEGMIAGPAEHLIHAHYVEHLQDVHPYAAHDNRGYRPDNFRTDGGAFPGRGSFRHLRYNNFRHKRRRF